MPHFVLSHGQTGPLIDLFVTLSAPRVSLLRRATPSQTPPPPRIVKALIDSGASHSSIDVSLIEPLRLVPTGIAQIITPTTGTEPVDTLCYDIGLGIPFPNGMVWTFPLWVVSGMSIRHQGFEFLLGRDILATGLFLYDGVHGTFTLSF